MANRTTPLFFKTLSFLDTRCVQQYTKVVFHNDQPCILFILPLGLLNIFVYEAEGSPTLLGHVDVSQPKPVWNSQTICPPRSVKPRADRFMSVVGSGGVSFAVDLSQNPSEITLDIPEASRCQEHQSDRCYVQPSKRYLR